MAQSSRTSGRRSRNTPEAILAATTRRLRSLDLVKADELPVLTEQDLEATTRRIRNLRRDEHTPRWCPATHNSILVGPDHVCPACGAWAPST